jgi:hypothetical protein
MTREYRITADSFRQEDTTDDCVLSPDDPIHDLKPAAMMGGIGSSAALAKYNSLAQHTVVGSTRGQEAREQNIKPGTEAWFKHWFGGAR